MKNIFDVELSKKLCPPNYAKGVHFKKRIVLDRSLVTYRDNDNVRTLKQKTQDVGKLIDSFSVNGFIHSRNPPTIQVDPDNPNRFIGLSGFHRDLAASLMGWKTMLYDVVECETPKAEILHKSYTNQTKDHICPAISMTEADYIKQIKTAVNTNVIKNNDDEVKSFLNELALDKTEKQKAKIFKKFRKHIGTSTTLVNYHSSGGACSTEEFAIKWNLPVNGDKRKIESGKLGYANDTPTPKTSLVSAKKLSEEYDGETVYFYTWIPDPKEAPALYRQREEHKQKFDEFMLQEYKFIQKLVEKCGVKLSIAEIEKHHPFKFGGFYAQDITPCAEKDGKPREEGIVDIKGNPI